MTATTELSTSPEDRAPAPPRVGPGAAMRRAWRTWTSMRTALLLLFLLAVAAVPGSLLPQRSLNPSGVAGYYGDHPSLAPWLDRLYAFDVYASPWFGAIYLALMVSLVGCLTPRIRLHVRALRSVPPAPPRNLSRLPVSRSFTTSASPTEVYDAARRSLRRWRVRPYDTGLSAERGYVRETGNIAFHLALLGLLAGVAMGAAWGYRGDVLVVEGDTFVNTPAAYDELHPGRLNTGDDLPPFEVTVDDFRARFLPNGAPSSYEVDVRWRPSVGAPDRKRTVRVNEPLTVRGARVYLLDHGYALHFTARLPDGTVVYDQWQPFLPDRGAANLVSDGVVKVSDLGGGLPDVGLRGRFVPTYARRGQTVFSAAPEALIPAFVYETWAGSLGLDSGLPQNVYELDTEGMVRAGGGVAFLGETIERLPGGLTVEFDGVKDFAVLHVNSDPGKRVVLVAAILALTGLILSLRIRRRRLWVKATATEAGTLVEVGGLARQDPAGYEPELASVAESLQASLEKP
ncbi:MAG TPA: cytochrome c biogenesis protein ResB [Frankiaceae bacterium]|nr:cytochrome c biogenesis protein ResB [Frankiaceae bacterium]